MNDESTTTAAAVECKPRPRDAAATKALLLRAATEEFAEHGLAGARIDRIADRAGANKRLIYVYFGDKDRLFDAVMDDQTQAVLNAVPLNDGDLVVFAATRFDYVVANPEARRIAIWRGFERTTEPTDAELLAYRARLDGVAAALHAATPGEPMSAGRLSEHRASLLTAVRSVVEPRG